MPVHQHPFSVWIPIITAALTAANVMSPPGTAYDYIPAPQQAFYMSIAAHGKQEATGPLSLTSTLSRCPRKCTATSLISLTFTLSLPTGNG
jgi:hypothetical protein